ncbi:MAG: AAA family ATPase [Candidatus Helarchaeota archaeon]|nr:AAA family ATPase [Candidatus Helarchaeota archaeon]
MKKLVISNFKTFNGSKELIFSKGYTILSGPNGSGKSNTLDAILFVLGRHDERLKKTVVEVISKDFSTNKLLADFAEVNLVFSMDNNLKGENESEEIIVSRQLRIPASGKAYSVYKLNGKETNLSEILKFIPVMDYNIVKQGEITSRMYETPESRRKLIEKVAGLAQLDPLISESTAKIINARETLKHIGLLLKEAQRRLKDLEKEKNRALNYRKLENELNKFKAIKIYSTKLELITKLNELEDQIISKKENITRIQTQISNLKLEIAQINQRFADLEQQKREFEKKKTEISIRYEMDLKQIEEMDQRVEELEAFTQSLEERIEKMKQDIRNLNQDKQKLLQRVKKSIEKEGQILNEIKEFQYQNKSLELTLPRLKEKVNELDLKRTSLFTEINEKDKILRQIDLQIRELRQKRMNLEEKMEEFEEIKQDQTSNLGKTTRELRRLEGQIKVNKQKIEKLKRELVLNQQLIDKQRLGFQELELKKVELQKEISHYQQLLQETKPNYSYAVQKVLEGRDKKVLRGVIGTIIELIEDIQSEYAIAIEAVGGFKLQNIVTRNFEITKQIINYVKKIKVGKITFYPLDTLQDWHLKSTPNDPKVIGKIIDLIKFDRDKYQRVMANIFKNTLLVRDLDTAKKYRSYRAVTLEGDLVEPGGWVTTRGKFEPRFLLIKEFYRKKINEKKAELDKIHQFSKSLKSEQEKLGKQNQTKQIRLEELVDLNSITKGRILELQKKIKDLEFDIKKWQNELGKIKTELMDTKAGEQNAHISLSKVLEELDALNKQKEEIEKEIAETELGKTEQLINKNRREILKLREQQRKFQKDRELFDSQINQIESSISIKTSRIEDINNRINEELLNEREKLLTKKKDIFNKIESEHAQLNSILENITGIEALQKELQEKHNELIEKINKNEGEIENFKKFIAEELQTKKIRIELRIQEIEKQILDLGFEITEDFEINLEYINQEINRLEIEMSSLGLIDHRAPEKFEAENTRLTELVSKKGVYEKELEAALETKSDLLTQKKLKFLKTISEINKYLNEIFVKLYGKGHASLVLIDKSNPLESGVDIKVDVGSGTVDYIGTLSGGEKSMVALAFIFAIQRYQTALIYFLDEIDSYLDDSHCEALGRLLKDLSENSQYIVITPRLNALSTYADRIYGVWLENGKTEIVCQQAEDFASIEGA